MQLGPLFEFSFEQNVVVSLSNSWTDLEVSR